MDVDLGSLVVLARENGREKERRKADSANSHNPAGGTPIHNPESQSFRLLSEVT